MGPRDFTSKRVDPSTLSQAELDEYLDRLVEEGREESPEFARAYKFWEGTNV